MLMAHVQQTICAASTQSRIVITAAPQFRATCVPLEKLFIEIHRRKVRSDAPSAATASVQLLILVSQIYRLRKLFACKLTTTTFQQSNHFRSTNSKRRARSCLKNKCFKFISRHRRLKRALCFQSYCKKVTFWFIASKDIVVLQVTSARTRLNSSSRKALKCRDLVLSAPSSLVQVDLLARIRRLNSQRATVVKAKSYLFLNLVRLG